MNELLGQTVELRHVPVVPGGNPVNTQNGRRAVVYDSPPEAAALSRWQEQDFLDVERRFAKAWRDALSGIDLDALFREGEKSSNALVVQRIWLRQRLRPLSFCGSRDLAM